jgi:hypothetical protein
MGGLARGGHVAGGVAAALELGADAGVEIGLAELQRGEQESHGEKRVGGSRSPLRFTAT